MGRFHEWKGRVYSLGEGSYPIDQDPPYVDDDGNAIYPPGTGPAGAPVTGTADMAAGTLTFAGDVDNAGATWTVVLASDNAGTPINDQTVTTTGTFATAAATAAAVAADVNALASFTATVNGSVVTIVPTGTWVTLTVAKA